MDTVLWFSWASTRSPDGTIEYDMPVRVEHSGYNRVRMRLIHSLRRAGLAVKDGGPPPLGGDVDVIQIAHAPLFKEPKNLSIWARNPRVSRAIIYTTFESPVLPKSWVEAANTFDAVWTTSEWNRKAFVDSGVTVPVFVIHHGVEAGLFPPMDRPRRRQNYTFLWQGMSPGNLLNLTLDEPVVPERVAETVFGDEPEDPAWYMACGQDPTTPAAQAARRARGTMGDRKQAFLVREAFMRLRLEGRIGDDARLVLKWTTIFNKRWEYAGWPVDGSPVDLYGCAIADEEMRALLYNVDCSVSPFRAEGFGLIPLEHMATGLPAIFTPYSGAMDYHDRPGSPPMGFPLAYDLAPSFHTESAIGAAYSKKMQTPTDRELIAEASAQGGFGDDAHVHVRSLMAAMEWCYREREAAYRMAQEWATIVHREWTWDRPVRQVVESLDALGWGDEMVWRSQDDRERCSATVFYNRHALEVA